LVAIALKRKQGGQPRADNDLVREVNIHRFLWSDDDELAGLTRNTTEQIFPLRSLKQ